MNLKKTRIKQQPTPPQGDAYNCDYLPYTTFRFYSIDFLFNADFPSQFHILP